MSRMDRLPEAERARAHPPSRWRPPNALIGVLFLIVAIVGPYIAFTDHIPGTSRGYVLNAAFANGSNLPKGAPVRIAGVNVGEVLSTESDGNNAIVHFTVADEGRPIRADATATNRPRMFLEGNNFIDLDPGSPSAAELDSDDTIPASQTATAVQLDEILTALQKPVRRDLQVLLQGYGTALMHEPTAEEDVTQDPAVQGKTAAEALNMAFDYGGRAGRASAQVTEAFRGTERHDLSRLIDGSAKTFGAFAARDDELRELVTNWSEFTGALADQSTELTATVRELEPTLESAQVSLRNLSESLPALRGFARALTPSLEELPGTIAAAEPWLPQALKALGADEAGGAAKLLERATPGLAGASQAGIGTIREIDLLSRCTSEVLVPTGDQVLEGPFSTGQPNSHEFFTAAVNIAGESQSFDGNGAHLRAQISGGDLFVVADNPRGDPNPPLPARPDDKLWARTISPPIGTQPQFGAKPPLRPGVKCFKNDVPDLNSGPGEVGPPSPVVATPPGAP